MSHHAGGGWPEALHHYFLAMRAAGRAPGTMRLHRHYLGGLAGAHRWPWRVSETQLVAYLAREGWAPETRKSARTVVAGFYRWAHLTRRTEVNPAAALPTVRVPAGLPRPTPEHLVRVLVGRDGRLGLMAMLAAYAGLRAGEVARVHGSDLDGDVLRVVGKGGKVRVVPIISGALLDRLAAVEGWAFPNGHGSHLSAGHVSRVMSAAMPAGWTAHTLRHRAGTQAYAGTRDLLAVGLFLGHSRPETTQRYVRLPDAALRAVAAAAAV